MFIESLIKGLGEEKATTFRKLLHYIVENPDSCKEFGYDYTNLSNQDISDIKCILYAKVMTHPDVLTQFNQVCN